MASEVDVANLALGRLRISQFIADLSENNNQARVCNRFFNHCRQEVLRDFPWNFSTRYEQLAEVSGQTFPGWGYVYQYPDDCMLMRAVADEGGIRTASRYVHDCRYDYANDYVRRWPFQIALKDDNASKVILSDVGTAYGFFSVDVENIGVWPSDALSAFAWRLAMEVAGPLQADGASIDKAEQAYIVQLSRASAQSFNESKDDPVPDSPSISCR